MLSELTSAIKSMVEASVREILPGELTRILSKSSSTTCSPTPSASPATPCSGLTGGCASHPYIGQYVVIRSADSGVHFGMLVSRNGSEYELSEGIRLWSWEALKGIALSGVAKHGINKKNSKLDSETSNYIHGVIECIPCSPEAVKSIKAAAAA